SRYDFSSLDADDPPNLGDYTPAVVMSYRYDADDNRVIKWAHDPSVGGKDLYTAYIFDSLELRRAEYGAAYGLDDVPDYELTEHTEIPYLFANGVRLARVVHEPQAPLSTSE